MADYVMPPKYSVEQIIDTMRSKNFTVFEGLGQSGTYRDFDLNLIGIRNSSNISNFFDDWYVCFYRLNKKWNIHYYNATLDPGRDELTHPSFPEAQSRGTFILKEGIQFKSAWTLGYHGGGNWRHIALLQTGIVTGYRDNDRDTLLDCEPQSITSGFYGINHHAASLWSVIPTVGRYGAGCQVIQDPNHHQQQANLWVRSASIWGPKFSYGILNQNWFK